MFCLFKQEKARKQEEIDSITQGRRSAIANVNPATTAYGASRRLSNFTEGITPAALEFGNIDEEETKSKVKQGVELYS